MPFTLSHAAAALPLRRLLRGTAVFPLLVIGCFIPDVPYFLPAPFDEINAHHWAGLIAFGIPSGWIIYAVWCYLLRAPAAALLPRAYGCLLLRSPHVRAVRWLPGTLSVLAGALSHIVWDAFTHRRGFVVHHWPLLTRPLAQVGGHGLPAYFLFQHTSTLIGLLCLALYVRRGVVDLSPRDLAATPQLSARRKAAAIAALTLATGFMLCWTFTGANAAPMSAYNLVCDCISAAALAAVAYAVLWHAGARWMHVRART